MVLVVTVIVHGIDGQAWFGCVPQVVLLLIEILCVPQIDSSKLTCMVDRLAPRTPRFVNDYSLSNINSRKLVLNLDISPDGYAVTNGD